MCDKYVEVALSLNANPRIFSLTVDLFFDESKLKPVIFEENEDLQDFMIVLPPVGEGRFTDRRVFIITTFGRDASNETGLITKARFERIGETSPILPLAVGRLGVNFYDPDFPRAMREVISTISDERLVQYGIPAPPPVFAAFSSIPQGRYLIGDASGDGRRTNADADILAGNIANLRYMRCDNGLGGICSRRADCRNYDETMDVDGNGWVGLHDVTLLLQWLSGWESRRVFSWIMEYRTLINSNANLTGRATDVMNYIEPIFRGRLGIILRRQSAGTTSSLNMLSGCLRPDFQQICGPDSHPDHLHCPLRCGNETGSNCHTLPHHRSARNLLEKERLNNTNTFRFVDYRICWYGRLPGTSHQEHQRIGGLAVISGNDMLVSLVGLAHEVNKMTSHEISHLFGAPDNSCSSEPCVMRYADDRVYSQWCTNCIVAMLHR
jgi:hypothetical protein